jgi:hypothetical protein
MYATSKFSSPTRNLLFGNIAMPVRCVKAGPAVVPVPPVLEHAGNTLPKVIPRSGGTYTVRAKTNLPSWGLKVYAGADNVTGTLVTDIKNVQGSADINTEGTYPVAVTVGANSGNAPRKFSFYLYSDHYTQVVPREIYIGTWSQEAVLTLPLTGFPAPPGVLGVTPSGELTLRGSALYKGTAVEKDSQFGPVHEEAVFVAYFRWGSLVAINSTSNATNPDALISNGDEFEFSDFDWIHPDYAHGGLTGAQALHALLGGGITPAQMWSTLPMKAGLVNWAPTNTTEGTGDPCPYATVDASGTLAAGYRIPDGNTNSWNGVAVSTARYPVDQVQLTNGMSVKGRRDKDVGANGWGMFLPFAGFRNTYGDVSGRGRDGNYWSRGVNSGISGNYYSSNEYGVGSAVNNNTMGFPIRCVTTVK